MSRLITEEAVIDVLKQTGIIQDNDLGHLVVDEINRIPTAYNVDKVVAEIEIDRQVDFNYHIRTDYRFLINHIYDKTVQKVRKGGVNE